MSKPSAALKRYPPTPLERSVKADVPPPAKPEIVVTTPTTGGSLNPNTRAIHLVFWWKTAPDPLLVPRIARTDTEWPGEWFSAPHPVDVRNEQKHEWETWWMAAYALPLTARVLRELERIRTLPQEEW